MNEEDEFLTEICKSILLDFTQWGLDRGDGFDDITLYDLNCFAEEWVNDNFKEEDGEFPNYWNQESKSAEESPKENLIPVISKETWEFLKGNNIHVDDIDLMKQESASDLEKSSGEIK